MAEFQDVMKQLARMTNACKGKCNECPLNNSTLCTGPWCFGNTEGIAEAERIIMQWAAEHPEPVYETWLEFIKRFETGKPKSDEDFVDWMGTTSIPADIAQKMGIKPKENL